MAQTVRQFAAEKFGNGVESASAEESLWNSLPTMDVGEVERIVRTLETREQFAVVSAAIKGGSKERTAALKARFTADEIQAMLKR